jgi:endoglucanase
VLYEIRNEPVAWGPPYLTGTTPAGAMDMEVEAYQLIRQHAPETPVLLFTYAVLGEAAGAAAALTDIHEFNQGVFANPNAGGRMRPSAFTAMPDGRGHPRLWQLFLPLAIPA